METNANKIFLETSILYIREVLDAFESELEEYGFKSPDIHYDLSDSGTSGVSFKSNNILINTFYKKEKHNMDFDFKFAPIDILQGDPLADFLGVNDEPHLIEELLGRGFFYGWTNGGMFNIDTEEFRFVQDVSRVNIPEFKLTVEMSHEMYMFKHYIRTYMVNWIETKCKGVYMILKNIQESYVKEWTNKGILTP